MESIFQGQSQTMRRPAVWIPEDEGLASLADMESGENTFSTSSRQKNGPTFINRALSHPRFSPPYEETHHFLDSCFLCKKPLSGNRDIFMYRGDAPFCSEECRQEQIDIDEAKEKNWNLSFKVSSRKEQQKSSNSSKSKNQDLHVRARTVVAG